MKHVFLTLFSVSLLSTVSFANAVDCDKLKADFNHLAQEQAQALKAGDGANNDRLSQEILQLKMQARNCAWLRPLCESLRNDYQRLAGEAAQALSSGNHAKNDELNEKIRGIKTEANKEKCGWIAAPVSGTVN